MEKACRKCKFLSTGPTCPVCGGTEFTEKWSGTIYIFDLSSEIAKKLGLSAIGRYAVKIKE